MGVAGKCKLFDACPLRIFYEATCMDNAWIKRYCRGRYRECGRFKLEAMEGRLAGKKPCPIKGKAKAVKGKCQRKSKKS